LDEVNTDDEWNSLQIQDDHVLKEISTRTPCPDCKKPVKYFCYKCHHVVGMDRSLVPTVTLPVHLDVLKHHKEIDGKSTAVHAKVLAEEDVTLYNWPEIPDYTTPERTLLLFPSAGAKRLDQIPRDSFDRIVVIDGTWIQAKQIIRDTPALKQMQHVTIAPRKTHFWRFQQQDDHHLATIEAIYYLYRELGETYESPYQHQYDDLLFYYKYFYHLIQETYQKKKTAKFNHRHNQKDYIKYS
ncbi:DTW domain-containing protein, partial [Pilobolus umbonatus]